ncbi:MAG: LacI family DNA-binding transcriptional regulator [Chthoniobacteraceae bacterium]
MAEYLGLSEWTVSRAINGHPEVKITTRDRIFKAMDELGFRPNPVARKLNGKAMGVVGVCFINAHSSIMIDKITLLDEFLFRHELRGILAISSAEQEKELSIIREFLHLQVDGMVLIQSGLPYALLEKMLGQTPYVLIDPADRSCTSKVWLDRGEAMRLTVQHLLDLGHRSFSTLGITPRDLWRWPGLIEPLSAAGLDSNECVQSVALDHTQEESYAEGMELANQVIASPSPSTALIALNDQIAIGAIRALSNAGYHVPNDFSVVGFDNLPVSRYWDPALTSIDQQTEKMISSAGELLLEALVRRSGSKNKKVVRIVPRLMIRGSTGISPLCKKS